MNSWWTFLLLAPLLAISLPARALDKKKAARQWEYLDNGMVRIGIDKSRGACIGYFAESRTRRNLLLWPRHERLAQEDLVCIFLLRSF